MKKSLLKSLLVVAVMFLGLSNSNAQDYSAAVGLRIGFPTSISGKFKVAEGKMVEAAIGYRNFSYWNWISLSGAYQIYKPIGAVDGLHWYWGGGASAYFWSFDNDNIFFAGDDYNTTSFGIQAYGGLDYVFENVPVNLSIDLVPTYFLNSYGSGFAGGYGAIGVRYTIGKE